MPGDEEALQCWQPVVLDRTLPDDARMFAELAQDGRVWHMHDALRAQLCDLAATRIPGKSPAHADLEAVLHTLMEGRSHAEYGRWVYYPWSGRLVHTLPPREFRELRLNRNRNKITADEQKALAGL